MKRVAVLLIIILAVAVWPACASGADITWTVQWQSNQPLVETVSGDNLSVLNRAGGWQAQTGAGGAATRTTPDWKTYSTLQQRLPIQAIEKNYFLFKTVRLEPDSSSPASSAFQQLMQGKNGNIIIEVPGFVKDYSAAEVKPTVDGFTVAWKINTGNGPNPFNFQLTAIILNILPIIITSLAVAWLIIWVLFRRQVKRMNEVIEEEYSLENLGTGRQNAAPAQQVPAADPEEAQDDVAREEAGAEFEGEENEEEKKFD